MDCCVWGNTGKDGKLTPLSSLFWREKTDTKYTSISQPRESSKVDWDGPHVAGDKERLLVQAMQTSSGSLSTRAAGPCWIVWNDAVTARGTRIRQLMITLLNLPILQPVLQHQCIYISTVGSLWLNFSCLQVTHQPRGHKQLSQADWTTPEFPSWVVVWCRPKPCWYTLLISLCLYLYLKHSICKKTSLPRVWSCLFSQLFWSFPQVSQMS